MWQAPVDIPSDLSEEASLAHERDLRAVAAKVRAHDFRRALTVRDIMLPLRPTPAPPRIHYEKLSRTEQHTGLVRGRVTRDALIRAGVLRPAARS